MTDFFTITVAIASEKMKQKCIRGRITVLSPKISSPTNDKANLAVYMIVDHIKQVQNACAVANTKYVEKDIECGILIACSKIFFALSELSSLALGFSVSCVTIFLIVLPSSNPCRDLRCY